MGLVNSNIKVATKDFLLFGSFFSQIIRLNI